MKKCALEIAWALAAKRGFILLVDWANQGPAVTDKATGSTG